MSSNQATPFQSGLARPLFSVLAFVIAFAGFSVLSPNQASAQAQTVQLPTFRNFVYRGAVMVPDGGTTMLGGVNRSSSGANSQGVPFLRNLPGAGRAFGNRGIGSENESSKSTVTAKVLIKEELEAQMLAEAIRNGDINIDAAAEAIVAKAAFLSKHVGKRSDLFKSRHKR